MISRCTPMYTLYTFIYIEAVNLFYPCVVHVHQMPFFHVNHIFFVYIVSRVLMLSNNFGLYALKKRLKRLCRCFQQDHRSFRHSKSFVEKVSWKDTQFDSSEKFCRIANNVGFMKIFLPSPIVSELMRYLFDLGAN